MFLTVTEAAKQFNITRQAVHFAIKSGRLKAQRDTSKLKIDPNDLVEFRKNRYSRQFSKIDGQLIYDDLRRSIVQTAEQLGVTKQKVYYLIRKNKIKAEQRRSVWIILQEDINKYKESLLGF